MTDQLNANGMSIAPGVVDTIIAIAVQEVEGVAGLGQAPGSNIRLRIAGKQTFAGIETEVTPEGKLRRCARPSATRCSCRWASRCRMSTSMWTESRFRSR